MVFNTEDAMLAEISAGIGLVSGVGAVVINYGYDWKWKRNPHRALVSMGIADALLACAWITRTIIMVHFNDFQAEMFLTELLGVCILYLRSVSMLCAVVFVRILYNLAKEHSSESVGWREYVYPIMVWCLPIVPLLASMPLSDPIAQVEWPEQHHQGSEVIVIFFDIPALLLFLFNVFTYNRIYWMLREGTATSMRSGPLLRHITFYLTAFLLSWIFGLVLRIFAMLGFNGPDILDYLEAIVFPARGLVDLFAYSLTPSAVSRMKDYVATRLKEVVSRSPRERGRGQSSLSADDAWDVTRPLFSVLDPQSLKLAKKTGSLEFSRMGLRGVPYDLHRVAWVSHSLKRLDLSGNEIKTLPNSFSDFAALTSLNLSDNLLDSLSSNLERKCVNLRVLLLARNKFVTVPTLGYLKNLEVLDLSGNELQGVGSRHLVMTMSQLWELGDDKGLHCPNSLTSLSIAHNKLTKFPPEFMLLANLQELDIAHNLLSQLPPSLIGQFTKLRRVRTTGNQWCSPFNEIETTSTLSKFSRRRSSSRATENGEDQGSYGLRELLKGTLDLSHSELMACPVWVITMVGLTSIDMSGNAIRTLPEEIGELKNLQQLNMSYNSLSRFPCSVRTMKMLEELDLSSNSLDSLPLELGVCSRLRILDISRNKLSSLFSSVGLLSNLQTLRASRNVIAHVPEELGECSGLVDCDLSHNFIETLPSLAHCTALRHFNLYENRIYDFPTGVLHCRSLEALTVGQNSLSELPEALMYCHSMTALDAEGNNISVIPRSIRLLKSLKSLNLKANSITDIPVEIGQCPRLERLNLANNFIHNIRFAELGGLPLVHELDVSENSNNLEKINLVGCRLSSLPSWVSKMEDTKTLNLSINLLSCLTPDVHLAPTLLELDLSHNDFVEIPPQVFECLQLKILRLAANKLNVVSTDIAKLTKLRVLDLSDNYQTFGSKLVTLPPEIGTLKLREINLKGNRGLTNPPYEIQRHGTEAVLAYLRDILNTPIQSHRMKLVVVGLENVGKTSLLQKLRMLRRHNDSITSTVPPSPLHNVATHGICVHEWKAQTKGGVLTPSKEITFSAWDFAGQDVYYASHQFFLSSGALYLVVWDLTKGEEGIGEVRQWLQSVKGRAGDDSSVILVGTHLDQCSQAYVDEMVVFVRKRYIDCPETAREDIPTIIGLYVVSCVKESRGIHELRQGIIDTALSKDTASVPASFLSLEKAIENYVVDGPPTMSITDFKALAARCDIVKGSDVDDALKVLHEWGVIVHFEDDALQSLIVLKPTWLIDVMASVLNFHHAFVKNGILMHDDLKWIWPSSSFPSSLHPQLLSLLQRFELLYQLKTSSKLNFSLVPALLPDDPPPDDSGLPETFSGLVEHNRIYRFPYVPPGFFNRIQMRMLCSLGVQYGEDDRCSMGDEALRQGSASSYGSADRTTKHSGANAASSVSSVEGDTDESTQPKESAVIVLRTSESPFTRSRGWESTGKDPLGGISVSAPPCSHIRDEERRTSSEYRMPHPLVPIPSNEVPAEFALDALSAAMGGLSKSGHSAKQPTDASSSSLSAKVKQQERHSSKVSPTPSITINSPPQYRQPRAVDDDAQESASLPSLQKRTEPMPIQQLKDRLAESSGSESPAGVGRDVAKHHRKSSGGRGARHNSKHGLSDSENENDVQDEVGVLMSSSYEEAEDDDSEKSRQSRRGTSMRKQSSRDLFVSLTQGHSAGTGQGQLFTPTGGPTGLSVTPAASRIGSRSASPEPHLFRSGNTPPEEDAAETDWLQRWREQDLKRRLRHTMRFFLWRSGLRMYSADVFAEMRVDNFTNELTLTVKSHNAGLWLGMITDHINTLLVDWFPGLADRVDEVVVCSHCIQIGCSEPKQHNIDDCHRWVMNGVNNITCNGESVEVELVIPDLLLTDFSEYMLDYSELEVLRTVGGGAIGTVYQANWKGGTNEVVAVKRFNSEVELRQFRQEVQVMRALRHPKVLSLLGICLRPLCLVTDFAPHGSLRGVLDNTQLSLTWKLRMRIAKDIAEGMAYLHQNGIIHRDLKSANILIYSLDPSLPPDQSVAKIADFDISRTLAPVAKGRDGTRRWMAPEVLKGQEYTLKADIFSFGNVLWELLTRQIPYPDIRFDFEVEDEILGGSLPPVPEGCPPPYSKLMRKCWAQPTSRPQFSELVSLIEEAQSSLEDSVGANV